jgi:predicted nucleic acid binding AN1-type Zn finger protein
MSLRGIATTSFSAIRSNILYRCNRYIFRFSQSARAEWLHVCAAGGGKWNKAGKLYRLAR